MENNEITKQMLDKIDALVRENETLKLANAAQAKQIEALETEVNTLRTAVHQMNLDHNEQAQPEQAQPDPKKAEEDRQLLSRDFVKRMFGLDHNEQAQPEQAQPDPKKAEEDRQLLSRDFVKRMFGLDLNTERAKAAIDCGDFIPAIEEFIRGWKSRQQQPSEYDRLRAQFPGVFEKYGPILGVAIIRKK